MQTHFLPLHKSLDVRTIHHYTKMLDFSSLQKRIWHKLPFESFLFIKKVLANALFTFTKKLWHTRSWSLQTNLGHTRFSSLQKRIWHKLAFDSRSEGALLFEQKKSGLFSFSGLIKHGFGCFEITESFNFSPVIVLKTVRLSDRQIWKTPTLNIKNPTFSGYQLTFRPRLVCKFNFGKWQKCNFCQIHCGTYFQEHFSVSYEYHSFQYRNCLEFEEPYHQDHIWETTENLEIDLLCLHTSQFPLPRTPSSRNSLYQKVLAFASFLFIKKVLANSLFTFTKNLWHTRYSSLHKKFVFHLYKKEFGISYHLQVSFL